MTVQTSAGTIYSVSAGEPATYDQAGFDALVYTVVGEVVDFGEIASEYETVTHNPVDTRRTQKLKGNVNDGTYTAQLGKDPSDAGQLIVLDGYDGANVDVIHSHKIEFQDGTIQYRIGKIYSYTTNIGSGNQVLGAAVKIEVENKMLEI